MTTRCATAVGLFLAALAASAAPPPPLDSFLREGRLRDGLEAYATPADNTERFSLAVLQSLDGLQRFGSGLGKLGVTRAVARSGAPFLRMGVRDEDDAKPPEVATPEKVASLFRDLKTALRLANETLAGVDDKDFGVEVDFSKARLDLDGDGIVAGDEMLLMQLGRMMQGGEGAGLVIRFDNADAVWLKGYTHFVLGVLDVFTSYDWMPVWNQCAHVIFDRPAPTPAIVPHLRRAGDADDDENEAIQISSMADLVAALHEMRLEPVRKDGLSTARDSFRAMVACSRICWERVQAETDNDREWLPSPTQTGPGGAKITAEQIAGWQKVLDELDAVLTGRKLLPHWRIKKGSGVNLDKLVNAPPRLDPVLWVQGAALVPFIEAGTVSDAATWETLIAPFGPGFALFALWSN